MSKLIRVTGLVVLLTPFAAFASDGLLTGDAYISSTNPTSNFGGTATMFAGGGATSIMQFSLSTLPSGTTSGNIAKATLTFYVNRVTTAGNVTINSLSSTFSESTVTYASFSGSIGAPFSGSIPMGAAQVSTFITVDVTTQVQSGLGGGTVGFAIVPDGTALAQFDTKESTTTSHPAQLQIQLTNTAALTSSNPLPGTAPGSIFVDNNTGSNPGSTLTVQGGSSASGSTDVRGGDLILAAGPGTGLGGGGNVRTQTAGANDLSGSSSDLLVDREIVVARGKQLTLSAPGFTSLMSIHLVGTHTAGGRIYYTVRATDGGSQIATEEGVIQYLATANSITCTVQTTDKLHLGTVNSGCTPGFFNPGSQPGVSIFDNVTFSSPAPIVVHEIYFRITNDSGSSIRLEP
jgi:hypothetical protein